MSWMWTNSSQVLNVLLIVTDGELQVTGNNTLLLVVACGVASKLKNFSGEIFENGSEVDCKAWRAYQSKSLRTDNPDRVPGAPAPTRCA